MCRPLLQPRNNVTCVGIGIARRGINLAIGRVASMPTTEIIVRCASCSGLNAHGLPYCMFCGGNLGGTSEVRKAVPRPCRACSIIDPLSHKFCVNCGSGMTILDHAEIIIKNDPLETKPTASRRRVSAQRKKPPAMQAFAAVAVLVCTVITAIYVFSQCQITQNTGVLVHATPIGAKVTIIDSSGSIVRAGIVNARGEVELTGLRPGFYQVVLSHMGYNTVTRELRIHANKLAAIGVHESLDLEQKQSDDDNKVEAKSVDNSNHRESDLSDHQNSSPQMPLIEQHAEPKVEHQNASGFDQTAPQEVSHDTTLNTPPGLPPAAATAILQQALQAAQQAQNIPASHLSEENAPEFPSTSSGPENFQQLRWANFPRKFGGPQQRFRRSGIGRPTFRDIRPDPTEAPPPPVQ